MIELATVCGWLAYHTHDSRRSTPGFPDLVLVRDVVLFVECKTDTGRNCRRHQQQWISAIDEAGGDARVWRPSDWTEIERTLTRRWGHVEGVGWPVVETRSTNGEQVSDS